VSAVVTPIDRYLAEQRDATAVERFARRHDADLLVPGERWYADRLPTSSPGPGEQSAFRVDLDQCTGCKSCVAACHSLNGLDDGESWRSVGQLVGRDADRPRMQHVPAGCHHCLDPACLAGCPTNAYEKDPFSGIVRHLDDQCIGCSYCELTCPYEVPTLNRRLGIVRKCDLCTDRLTDGEAPACVQACPTSAITITVVDVQQVRAETRSGAVVPGAPASALTGPTTQYVGASDVLGHPGSFDGADHHAVRPSRGHPPLAVMLVLTQLSVGAMLATVLADFSSGAPMPAGAAAGAALAGVVALGASVLHLGRPAMAWRAVLGVGHSWLSREIVAFGIYAAAATAYAGASVVRAPIAGPLAAAAAASGITAVGCSALVYIVTGRASWRARATVWRFAATAASTGPLLFTSIMLWASAGGPLDQRARWTALCAVAVTASAMVAKLGGEVLVLRTGRSPSAPERARAARLLTGPLALQSQWRFALGGVGGIVGPAVMLLVLSRAEPSAVAGAVVATLALACTVAGELVERHQFFTASVAPRMPGGSRR
jgi:formate dehydrogenase iron-sulfur subunit